MLNYGVRVFYGITIVLKCRRDTPPLVSAIHCLLPEELDDGLPLKRQVTLRHTGCSPEKSR